VSCIGWDLHGIVVLLVGVALSKALNCLACCWLGQLVNTWQVEMGWPDMHWLARDLGLAGGSHCVSLGQELEYAIGA